MGGGVSRVDAYMRVALSCSSSCSASYVFPAAISPQVRLEASGEYVLGAAGEVRARKREPRTTFSRKGGKKDGLSWSFGLRASGEYVLGAAGEVRAQGGLGVREERGRRGRGHVLGAAGEVRAPREGEARRRCLDDLRELSFTWFTF